MLAKAAGSDPLRKKGKIKLRVLNAKNVEKRDTISKVTFIEMWYLIKMKATLGKTAIINSNGDQAFLEVDFDSGRHDRAALAAPLLRGN